jgi:F-type H+-transporting ATPase subunit epsilon
MAKARYKATFKISIMTPDALLYQDEVESAFFTGDQGEYELLPYHYPVIGVLEQGNIIINWREAVPIKFGIVKFFANDCIVLVEEIERIRPGRKKKGEDDILTESDDSVHHV